MKKSKFVRRLLALMLVACSLAGMLAMGVSAEETTQNLKAIKMDINWNDTVSSGMMVSRLCLKGMEGMTIRNGDTLSYQVYIPSDGNYVYGMGAFDGQSGEFASTGYWFPNFQDGAGMNNFDQLDQQGTDRWITREYTFTQDASFWHLGPAVITNGDNTAMAGKTSTVYYRNIVIKRADGTIEPCYTDSVAMGNYESVYAETAGKCSVSLTDGFYTFKKAGGSETPDEPEITEPEVTEPETPDTPANISNAYEVKIEFNETFAFIPPSGNIYNWYGFGAAGGHYASVKLNPGDKLSYKLYIPSGSAYVPGMGTLDVQETTNWAVLSWQSGITDQNGNPYNADLAATYGRDQWIEIVYDLPAALTAGGGMQQIGPRNNFGAQYLKELEGKTAYYYMTDVRIIHPNGTHTNIAPPQTMTYNVNPNDDLLKLFGTTTMQYIKGAGGQPETPDDPEIPAEPTEPVVPDGMDPNAIEVVLQFDQSYDTTPTTDNVYNWYGLGTAAGDYADITLNSGDKLSYKIYIPSGSAYVPGMGVIDVQENSTWGVLSFLGTVKDQNGNDYYADLATLYGTDQWIEIVYDLPDSIAKGSGIQHIGPRHNFGAPLLEALKGKTAYYYLMDVKIVHADGTESLIAPPQTMSYNVNQFDDPLAPFATTKIRALGASGGPGVSGEPEEIGDDALKFEMKFNDEYTNAPTEGNVYNWYGFGYGYGAFAHVKLRAGTKLSYKLYIPSDSAYVPGMGTIDIQEDSKWSVLSFLGGIKDQNGVGYAADLAEIYGRDRWIEIEYELPAAMTAGGGIQHIGPRNNFGAMYLEELKGQTAYYYLKDVKIIQVNGREDKISPPMTKMYNVNKNDDFLRAFTTVTSPVIVEAGSKPETPEKPDQPKEPIEITDPVVPEGMDPSALEVVIQFGQNDNVAAVSGNLYNWYGLGSEAGAYAGIILNPGDKLSYQLYIPGDSAYVSGMGVIDLQENSNWGVLSFLGTVKDQNGNKYYSDLAALYGTDQWIEIVYDLPDSIAKGSGIQHIGPRNNIDASLLKELKGKTAYYYLKDVKIIHADGTESLIAPPQTMSYNVNELDDPLSSYAATRIRVVEPSVSDTPTEPEETVDDVQEETGGDIPEETVGDETKNPDTGGYGWMYVVIVLCVIIAIALVFVILKKRRLV